MLFIRQINDHGALSMRVRLQDFERDDVVEVELSTDYPSLAKFGADLVSVSRNGSGNATLVYQASDGY